MAGENPFLSLPKVSVQEEQQTAANPFLSLPKADPQQQQQQQVPQQQQAVDQGIISQSFEDKLEIFNRGFERYALGGIQLLNAGVRLSAGILPGIGEEDVKNSYVFDEQLRQRNIASQRSYEEAYARTPSPVVDFLGNVGGATVASAPALMATTAAGPASALRMVGQGVASGAAAGATDYSESTGERATKAAIGGAVGGAIPAGLYSGQAVLERFIPGNSISGFIKKFLFPVEAAKQDIAQAVVLDSANNVDDALARVLAAKKSGIGGATPAEMLSTNPKSQIRATEAGIKVGDADKGAVAESIIGRTNQAKQQIYDKIASLNDPKIQAAQKDGFAKMAQDFVAPDGTMLKGAAPESLNYVPDVIKNNTVLSNTLKAVQEANIPGWGDLPANSVAQLHKVKDVIDDQLMKATPNKQTGAIAKAMKLIPEKELKAAKAQLVNVLEKSDGYNEAMAATNLIKRNQYYNEMIDATKATAGSGGELTLEQLTDAVIPNVLRQKEFVKDVVKTGGDAAQVEKLIKVAESLKGSPLWNVLKGGGVKDTYAGANKLGIVQQFVSDLTMDRYFKAMLDVTLSGDKWADDIAKVLSIKAGEQQQKGFMSLILNAAKGLNAAEKTTRSALTTTSVETAREMTGQKRKKYGTQF